MARTAQPRNPVIANPIFTTGRLITHIAARLNTDLNTSGGTVNSIRESATGTTISTVATKPTFVVDAVNGLPAFDFASAAGKFGTGGTRESSVNQTAYAVFRHSGVGTLVGDSVNGSAYLAHFGGSTFYINSGTVPYSQNTSLVVGTWYLLSLVRTNNSASLYINGALIGTFTVGTNSGSGTILFNRGTSDTGFKGRIAEIAVYSGAHTTNERQRIERGLGDMYGITTSVSAPVQRVEVGQDYGSVGQLLFLYDANRMNAALADGALVDTWADSSSAALAATAAGAVRPTFSKNTDGYGNSSIRLGGTQYMTSTIPSFDQPFTLFFVVKADGVTLTQYVFDGQTLDKVPALIFSSFVRFYAGTAVNSAASLVAGQTFMATGVYNGASSVNRLNGVSVAGNVGAQTGVTSVKIGASGASLNPLTGNIFLIGAYKGALTTAQLVQLENINSARFQVAIT